MRDGPDAMYLHFDVENAVGVVTLTYYDADHLSVRSMSRTCNLYGDLLSFRNVTTIEVVKENCLGLVAKHVKNLLSMG